MWNDSEEHNPASSKRGLSEDGKEDESDKGKRRKHRDWNKVLDHLEMFQNLDKNDGSFDLEPKDSFKDRPSIEESNVASMRQSVESDDSSHDGLPREGSANMAAARQSIFPDSMPDQSLGEEGNQEGVGEKRFVMDYEDRILDQDSVDYEAKTFYRNKCYFVCEGAHVFAIKHFLHNGSSKCVSALCIQLVKFNKTKLETVQDTSNMEDLTPRNIDEFVQRAGSEKEMHLSLLEAEVTSIAKIPDWMYIECQSGSSSLLFGFVDTSKQPIRNGLRHSSTKAIDFFAGAGLASRGFEAAGCKVVASVEKNKEAVQSYAVLHNAPESEISSDEWKTTLKIAGRVAFHGTVEAFLTKYKNEPDFRKGLGSIDVCVLCPPCQGFSKQNIFKQGNAEQNNNESLRILDAAKLIRPKALVFENVLGLWERTHIEKYFQDIVYGLMNMGYNVLVGKLCAVDFGDPQFRPRLILIASLSVIGLPVYPRPTHGRPFLGGDFAGGLLPVVTAQDALRSEEGKHPEKDKPINEDDRKKPNEPAATVMASKSAPHYSENRYYSLEENAILMGHEGKKFVEKLEGNHKSKQRQIGNGVPMELTKAIARAIQEVLKWNWVGVDDITADSDEGFSGDDAGGKRPEYTIGADDNASASKSTNESDSDGESSFQSTTSVRSIGSCRQISPDPRTSEGKGKQTSIANRTLPITSFYSYWTVDMLQRELDKRRILFPLTWEKEEMIEKLISADERQPNPIKLFSKRDTAP